MEKSEELQESFVSEFIFDFYDVIEDKRLETEEQEIPVYNTGILHRHITFKC